MLQTLRRSATYVLQLQGGRDEMLPGLRASPVPREAPTVSVRKTREVRYACPECGTSRSVRVPTRERDEGLEAYLERAKRQIVYDHMTNSPACMASKLEGPIPR